MNIIADIADLHIDVRPTPGGMQYCVTRGGELITIGVAPDPSSTARAIGDVVTAIVAGAIARSPALIP